MSVSSGETGLLKPGLLGRWIFERFNIWQMGFVSDHELARIASARGLMSLAWGDYIKRLWQLGLLRADLIESSEKVDIYGLNLVGQDLGNYYYSDDRELLQEDNGFGDAIARLPQFPSGMKLYFHPFRYYVFYQLDRILDLNISPLQTLISQRYPQLLEAELLEFQRWSTSADFPRLINYWNDIVSLTVAAEPSTFTKVFGLLRRRYPFNTEEQQKLVNQHWFEFKEVLREIGLKKIEEARDDPNNDVHMILRLTEGEARLKIKGHLGGAVYLLTMAEMLRRAAEDAFKTELREEDELGHGPFTTSVKENLYGSSRIIDGTEKVKNAFLRSFGLDYGVRLRWYVEGDTEYEAIASVFGRYTAVDLVNLRGQVVAKGGKGTAFRDSLRSDLRTGTFSFISLDGDRDDYLRVVRKAAEDDEICGMFFISRPDFEFANFTKEELIQIVWEWALENNAHSTEYQKLVDAVKASKSGEELLKLAKGAVPALLQAGKGRVWGERLMRYAWDNPEMTLDNGAKQTRQIVDAVDFAIKGVTVDDYHGTRGTLRVDPTTGKPVKRNPQSLPRRNLTTSEDVVECLVHHNAIIYSVGNQPKQ
jgi:hypothetical protein